MQTRGIRIAILALLLIAGVAAGYHTFDIFQQIVNGLDRERDLIARLERLSAAAATVGAAHGAYVAPGQSRAEWLARAAAALQLLREEVAMLRRRARSAAAAEAIVAMRDAVDSIDAADAAAREHLRIGEDLMASDLLYAEGRQALDALFAQIHDLQAAERVLAEDERAALSSRGGAVLAAWALAWAAGLFAFARLPRQPARNAVAEAAADETAAAGPVPGPEPQVSVPIVDEAAAICTELSRLTTTAGLPELLARTARILDASGLIVWLGAGEDLFAAVAHGYDPRVIARLGPIRRHADNATAAAWRAGDVRIVAGGPGGNGAIVAPLFGPEGCAGVLAAEVRNGREADRPTRAVTALIAAQLAAIVAAWPAPSVVEGPAAGDLDRPAAATA